MKPSIRIGAILVACAGSAIAATPTAFHPRLEQARMLAQNRAAPAPGLDTEPPKLVAFDVGTALNAGSSTDRLSVRYTVKDSGSGFVVGYADLRSPSGQIKALGLGDDFPAASFTRRDGMQLGDWAEPGTWHVVDVILIDAANNQVSYDETKLAALGNTAFVVTNKQGGDLTPPTVVGGSIETPSVSLTAPIAGTVGTHQPAVVKLSLVDAGGALPSGIAACWAVFATADSAHAFSALASYSDALSGPPGSARRDVRAGTEPGQYGAPAGSYQLRSLLVLDNAGNATNLTSTAFGGETDFGALFPGGTTIVVTP